MSPLKEESRTSSSEEGTSLFDDDDSIVDTDDEGEENSLTVQDGRHRDQRQQQQHHTTTSLMVDRPIDTISHHHNDPPTRNKYHPPSRLISASSSDQLSFDMDEPWERSLARQLEQGQCDDEDNCYRPEYMFVGHTESSDFMLPVDQDDAASLGTSVSSTVPTKNQWVHRSLLMRGLEPDGAHTNDASADKQPKKHVRRDSARSQLTTASEDERDDTGISTIAAPLLALIDEQRRKPTPMPESQLKRESFTVTDDESIQYYVNNESISSLPDPACFCLGYNVFDVVLPPLTTSSRAVSGRRRSMPRRTSQLFRVEEHPGEKQALSPAKKDEANRSHAAPTVL